MKLFLLSLSVLLATCSAPVFAQSAPPANVQMQNGQPRAVTPVAIVDGSGMNVSPAQRTTAAGTSDTQAVPVQGVTNGVPQNVQGVANGVPQNTIARGPTTLVTTQVSVGTTATLIAAARTYRSRIVITQSAAGPCYYGPTTAVSATTGARLTAAGASKVYVYSGALYGICPGGAVTTDTDEEY